MLILIRIFFVLALTGFTQAGLAEATIEASTEPFAATNELRTNAEQAGAPLLAPRTWEQANALFGQALKAADEQQRIDLQSDTNQRYQQAIDLSAAATTALASAIEARNAAQLVNASRLASDDWLPAEKKFSDAVQAMESGKAGTAEKRQVQATQGFRIAELNAIRTLILGEVWRLLAEADQKRTEKYAPVTLSKAVALTDRANAMLIENRYDTREPTLLAEQAAREAKHAIFVSATVQSIRNDEQTVEAFILGWEKRLTDIAETAGVDADFSEGAATTIRKIKEQIVANDQQLEQTERDLRERDALIIGLEDEIRDLDERLAGVSSDRSSLIRKVEQQARLQEQYEQVEALFSDDEAEVLQNGDTIVLRLIGLSFAPNSAKLNSAAQKLLAKTEKAINIYPQCTMTVEGHTDAQGGAEPNLQLSDQRAQAVRSYLTDVLRIPGFRVTAQGYGDTRPIANNKTPEGRTRNRRIDLIITPSVK